MVVNEFSIFFGSGGAPLEGIISRAGTLAQLLLVVEADVEACG
jgi:hypothetical protein